MELTLTTPALLFPTISLLMVAYSNRFLTIAGRIRSLHDTYKNDPNDKVKEQIRRLRTRLYLIKNMQALGVTSLFSCVLCMFVLFAGYMTSAKLIFAAGLLLLLSSLTLSFREVQISVEALNLELSDMENHQGNN